MSSVRKAVLALVPLPAVGASTSLSDQYRALITAANQNADQAKQQAAEALAAAQAAQTSAAQESGAAI
jgi:hypothetical protein